MTLLVLFAAADLLVGVGLLWHARARARQPEPVAVTGIVLLLCAAGLLLLAGDRLLHPRAPQPPASPGPSQEPPSRAPGPDAPVAVHPGGPAILR